MSVSELIKTAEFLVDAEGRKKAVQVELAVWEEIVAALEKEAGRGERARTIRGKYAHVPTSSADFARRKQEDIELEA